MNERKNPNHDVILNDCIRRRDALALLESTADPETFKRQLRALQEIEAPSLQPWTEGSKRMLASVYRLLSGLGMTAGVLGCIGSWGDTLPDDEVADMLEEMIEDHWPSIQRDAKRCHPRSQASRR